MRYVPFGFAPTKLRHFETCSYKILLMTVVTGCVSPRDVISSELSHSRVIVQRPLLVSSLPVVYI